MLRGMNLEGDSGGGLGKAGLNWRKLAWVLSARREALRNWLLFFGDASAHFVRVRAGVAAQQR